MGDIFEIRADISLVIAEKFRVQLAGEEKEKLMRPHTGSLEAHHLYLKGHFFRDKATPEDLRKAIDYFNQAIETDPNYALAYVGIATTYNTLGFHYYIPHDEAFPRAKRAAARALELDPELAEAHASLGLTQVMYDWNWEGAERTIRNALKSSPNLLAVISVSGAPFLATNRPEEALEFLQRAVDLDPLSVGRIVQLGMGHLHAEHVEQAEQQFKKALDLTPNHPYATWLVGQVHIAKKQYDEAIQEIEKAKRLSNEFPPIVAALGWAYAAAGRTEEAREIYAELQKRAKSEYIRPFLFAKLHAAFGEIDQAFQWLEKAYEERDTSMTHILTDESIEALRSDPRYLEILKKMKLDQYA